MFLQCLFAIMALVIQVHSHGNMLIPISWHDSKTYIYTDKGYVYDYVGMKSGLMCVPGRALPQADICNPNAKQKTCDNVPHPGGVCFWYTNGTRIKKQTLFDHKYRTYLKSDDQENIKHHPWMAPGTAPLDSPCGVAGGNINGCDGGCEWEVGGFAGGPRAEQFRFRHKFHVTNYTRGQETDVAWSVTANHGGGYIYRLCKLPKEGVHALTEECFQETVLPFVGDKQWIQYGEDETTRFEIPAVRLSNGTFPEGSVWTRNPIPACSGARGGFFLPTGECVYGTQFDPPGEGLAGFGLNAYHTYPRFKFSIVDRIQIPKHLPSGEYIMSFRWDCEETPQVWNTCASVNLD